MKINQDKILKKIEALLTKVRPYIQLHGGDVRLASYENGILKLQISGSCADCKLADLTYNNMVSGLLKDEVPEIKEILIIK